MLQLDIPHGASETVKKMHDPIELEQDVSVNLDIQKEEKSYSGSCW